MRVDLHTHTTASDGTLSPEELLVHADQAGIDMLAITDHDTVDGYLQLETFHKQIDNKVRLIAGTEISSYWSGICIHIVGLNIDLDNAALKSALKRQQRSRVTRAAIIARRLEQLGFSDTLSGAQTIAQDAPIGRLHFARHLVATEAVKDYKTAFRKYLGAGKAGDVKSEWAEMAEAINWIIQAGGTAVLAHPAKYKLTNMKLEALAADFRAAGGQALEVVSGQQDTGLTARLGKLARRHQLRVSTGSDFHAPAKSWAALGRQPNLPADCDPVWEAW